MISDSQYSDWLRDDSALRCLLVETTMNSGGIDVPVRLSSRAYITLPTDTPANTEYLPIVQDSVKLTEDATIDGSASMSYGTVELENNEGEYDGWLDAVWVNRTVTILFGDVRWARSDFRTVFSGVIADIDSSARNRLSFKLRDRLQLLNTPITEVKLGGTTDNKDRLRPLLFGEVHNFEPLLIDPPTHTYQFHYGMAESSIEVRDDGVPVTVTPTLATGIFSLTASPKGTITMSAQGDNNGGYVNTIAGIIKRMVMNFGRVGNRFTANDIDTTSLTAFDGAHPQPVGIPITDKANVLETCQNLAASVGALMTTSRQGLMQLIQINPASGAADAVTVTADDMVDGSLKIVQRLEVSAAVKLGYCQNWSVQTDLQSGIPESSKNLFKLDWLTTTQQDQSVMDLYKLHAVPEQEDTFLLVEADAITEANRRLTNRKVPRTVYQYTGFADALDLKLGKEVFLKYYRFGLTNGKYGTVVGLEPDWINCRCTVKVMI